jgi:hypothetical protein
LAADGDGASSGVGMGSNNSPGGGTNATSDSDSPANADTANNNAARTQAQQNNAQQNQAKAQSLGHAKAERARSVRTSALSIDNNATDATQNLALGLGLQTAAEIAANAAIQSSPEEFGVSAERKRVAENYGFNFDGQLTVVKG